LGANNITAFPFLEKIRMQVNESGTRQRLGKKQNFQAPAYQFSLKKL
jgi:hypothetical protein